MAVGDDVPFIDTANVDVTYHSSSDVLAVEFGSRAKRSWNYAYEDLLVMHGGTVDGRPVLQGITLINAKAVRRKVLERRKASFTEADLELDLEEARLALTDFYQHVFFHVVGNDLFVGHRSRVEERGLKFEEQVTPAISFVHDIAGRLVGITLRGAGFALGAATLKDMLDMFFDALLGAPDAAVDPKRFAFGNAVLEAFAPALAA